MPTYGKKLLDVNGNIILPKTRSSLVYMDDNETVEDTISSILSEITKIKDGTTTTNASKILGNTLTIGGGTAEIKFFAVTDQNGKYIPSMSAFNDQNQNNIATTYMPKSGGIFTGEVTLDCNTNADGSKRNVAHNPFRVGSSKNEFFRNIMISQNSVYQGGTYYSYWL